MYTYLPKNNDRRECERIYSFIKIYYENRIFGYILDLSKEGMKLLLPKKLHKLNLSIKSKKLDFSIPDLKLKKIWEKHDNSRSLYEYGFKLEKTDETDLNKFYELIIILINSKVNDINELLHIKLNNF